METEKKQHGGARPGSGRPKGSGNKINAIELIIEAERTLGKPFIQSLLEGYVNSIDEKNNKLRFMYEQLILNKVIADRHQVEHTDTEEAVEQKRQAFADALATIAKSAKEVK